MEELDKKWILLNNTNCDTTDSPSTLGLDNLYKHQLRNKHLICFKKADFLSAELGAKKEWCLIIICENPYYSF